MSDKYPPLGTIKVGDSVHVRTSRGSHDYVGIVTKVGRVWITVKESVDGWREDRFRKDSQADGRDYGIPDRFETPAQYVWSNRHQEALKYLRDQGLDIRGGTLWYGRRLELANILRRAEGLEEL